MQVNESKSQKFQFTLEEDPDKENSSKLNSNSKSRQRSKSLQTYQKSSAQLHSQRPDSVKIASNLKKLCQLSNIQKLKYQNPQIQFSQGDNPTFILTIKMDQDKYEELKIRQNQPIDIIASHFCQKHGLDEEIQKLLAQRIYQSISQIEQPTQQHTRNKSPFYGKESLHKFSSSSFSFLKDLDLQNMHQPVDKYDDQLKSKQRLSQQIYGDLIKTDQSNETFKPTLSKNTQKIMIQKSRRVISPDARDRVHERLYIDAKNRQENDISNSMSPMEFQESKITTTHHSRFQSLNKSNQRDPNRVDVKMEINNDKNLKKLLGSSSLSLSQIKVPPGNYLSTTTSMCKNINQEENYPQHKKSFLGGGISTTNILHSLLHDSTSASTSACSGQRMYLNCAREMHQKQKKLRKIKQEINSKKSTEQTFKPKINQRSKFLLPHRKFQTDKTEDILLKAGESQKDKLEMMKRMHEEENQKKIPFHPQISEQSQKQAAKRKMRSMAQSQQLSEDDDSQKIPSSLHQQLFREARKKNLQIQQNIRKSVERITFHPTISRGPKDERKDAPNIHQRLYSNEGRRALSKEPAPAQPINIQAIQAVPTISRGPNKDHRGGDKIYEYLYKQERERSLSIENKRKVAENELIEKVRKKNYDISVSLRICENAKNENLKRLFDMMDSNNDGEISQDKIDITGLQSIELSALQPLLLKLEQQQQGKAMKFSEFKEQCNKLIPTLDVQKRNAIITKKRQSRSKGRIPANNLSFVPTINQKSQKIANIRNAKRQQDNLWSFLNSEQNIIIQKRKQIEQLKYKEQLNGCSFKPEIQPSPLYHSNQASFRSQRPKKIVNEQEQGNQQYYQTVSLGIEKQKLNKDKPKTTNQ